ncbi:MAG TPA: DUF6114 domain-containing protein [Streptosporangiaceae bacterium]|nr:DUF6114 domain-containing protein [Streptosporangiaceae bacterium]
MADHLIPLSGILVHGAVKLVVYIGIGGVFGVLLGVLLIACGLLLWLNPAHRTFYAIVGGLLAVLSFIASNFGGFFIGMLLAQTTVTTNSSLDFSGGVVLYATKLSGSLLGVPVTLTPGNVVTLLLKLLNSLTPLVPVTMTNVTTDDFLVASGSLQANDLTITSG